MMAEDLQQEATYLGRQDSTKITHLAEATAEFPTAMIFCQEKKLEQKIQLLRQLQDFGTTFPVIAQFTTSVNALFHQKHKT